MLCFRWLGSPCGESDCRPRAGPHILAAHSHHYAFPPHPNTTHTHINTAVHPRPPRQVLRLQRVPGPVVFELELTSREDVDTVCRRFNGVSATAAAAPEAATAEAAGAATSGLGGRAGGAAAHYRETGAGAGAGMASLGFGW